MFISPYIPTDHTAGTVDPLGIMRPFGLLADQLFRQFTVLTWNPAYHGFLCFALKYAADHGRVTRRRPLGPTVREMEILWGLINRLAGSSILNTTKFSALLDPSISPGITYQACLRRSSLFDRLGYGVLGHYTGPSRYWGLIDVRTGQLSKNGELLGLAWGQRCEHPFDELLTAWLDGHTPAGLDEFTAHCQNYLGYALNADPSNAERDVWVKVIRDYCARWPQVTPLWADPIAPELLHHRFKREEYHKFFDGLTAHYQNEPQLRRILEVCRLFEELAGLMQTVFDWQYVRRLDSQADSGEFKAGEKLLADLSAEIVQDYEQAANQAKLNVTYGPAEKLRGVHNYRDIAETVYYHHQSHQRGKGGSPYFREDQILIADRVDKENFLEHLRELIQRPDRGRSLLASYQARDWHFSKALDWLKYAGVENVRS